METLNTNKQYNEVIDLIAQPIFSESARKKILSVLTLAYENVVRKNLLDATLEDKSDLYWDVPMGLHNLNAKKQKMFAKYADIIKEGIQLVNLRNDIKKMKLSVKEQPNNKVEEIKKEVIASLNKQDKTEMDVTNKLNEALEIKGMNVSIGGHWVHTEKSSFVRFFWYLNGEVTALSKIMYIAEQLHIELEK